MIEEQDRRYRESLEADRLKEEKKMEAERLKVEEQELKEVSHCSHVHTLCPVCSFTYVRMYVHIYLFYHLLRV